MADHFVTVPDSLELPPDVKVPVARLSDAGTAGRTILDAETAADGRTALGLGGASVLNVGTGAGDVKAGNYQPTADNISDATAAGRGLLTAADVAAQRATLGLNRILHSFAPLRARMADAYASAAIQCMSDSTGDGATEWPYLIGQHLATLHPEWTVRWMVWDDATQAYAAPVTIQTGAAGTLCATFASGRSTRKIAAVDSPHLSGVIDIRARLSLPDWTPAASTRILGRTAAAPNAGWYVFISPTGVPSFAYSVDGSAVVSMAATAPVVAADGDAAWLRWVWTPDNGSSQRTLQCYQGTDGVTWAQIGTTVTTAGAVTLWNPATAQPYTIGGTVNTGYTCSIYEVEIRDGLNGPLVAPATPDLWNAQDYGTPGPVTGAPILTIVNGSKSGASLSYLGDPTRLPKLTPDYGQVLTVVSDSHNEWVTTGKAWRDALDSFATALTVRLPGAAMVWLTQNPQTPAASRTMAHRQRRHELYAWATARRDDVIDTYQAFLDYDGDWVADLMADTVHPNNTGRAIMAAEIAASYDAS